MSITKEDAIREMIRMMEDHFHFDDDEIGPEAVEELIDERNAYRAALEELRDDVAWGENPVEIENTAHDVLEKYDN